MRSNLFVSVVIAIAAGEGVPFVIERYTAVGPAARTLTELEAGDAVPIPLGGLVRHRDLPTDGAIVRF